MTSIISGAVLHGYSSDVTRTFMIDAELPQCASAVDRFSHVWKTVYDAQSAGISTVEPGRTCSEVDLAARNVIKMKGLGAYFTHRVGHGLGIEGHEKYVCLICTDFKAILA
jgi:Xaa-Pro aminopeptidase